MRRSVKPLGKKIAIRIDLEGKDEAKFRAIKKHLGLCHNSEVVRQMITQVYESLIEKPDRLETS